MADPHAVHQEEIPMVEATIQAAGVRRPAPTRRQGPVPVVTALIDDGVGDARDRPRHRARKTSSADAKVRSSRLSWMTCRKRQDFANGSNMFILVLEPRASARRRGR